MAIRVGTEALAPADNLKTGAPWRLWVVPHTHWDREWYLPFEHFRLRLARTVDEILDVLEADPRFAAFTLDGQAIVLEDYLELRPEQAGRLRALVSAGRLAIGPSYVLPDEYLAGQEALIRNLLLGRQVCQHFGSPMPVGYLPDTFGHVAQLPQLLRGFGLETFVFYRGLGDEADDLGAVFTWQAPDGSQVLAIRQLDGYGNANALGRWSHAAGQAPADPAAWPAVAAQRLAEFLARYGPPLQAAGLRDVLLCNGTDHEPIQRDLPAILAACQARLPEHSFQIATYEAYVAAIRDAHGELQSFAGELCGGREAPVLRGVNSTRLYLKQANAATEQALFLAEALAALAQLRADYGCQGDGGTPLPGGQGTAPAVGPWAFSYPQPALRLAWRELLRNLPHDSICGCSVDEVHQDMLPRFRTAQHLAERIRREALAALAGQSERWSYREAVTDAPSLVNVLPWARTRLAELALPPTLQGARRLVAETAAGPLPVQLVESSAGQRRAAIAARVPGLRGAQVRLRRGVVAPPANAARAVGPRAIENEFYRLEAAPDGSLTVTDRQTGQVVEGLHVFEDQADRGDEYTFCPLEGEQPWDSRGGRARVRVKAAGPVVAELQIDLVARLPRALAARRRARSRATVACPIRVVARLVAGVDRVEFRTAVTNRARDHRLRVRFAAPESDQTVRAEGHFAVLRRPAVPVWSGAGWSEPPADTHHTLGMVAAGRLALFSRGLPEYQAVPRPDGGVDLALTLLRCVGWLSRDDLSTRPGGAGPALPTPAAQCLGDHVFEYAISLRGHAADAALVRAAQDYRVDLAVGPPGADTFGSLQVDGDGFALAALKGAEDGDGLVLRLYNPGQTAAVATVKGVFTSARTCRLDETEEDEAEQRTLSLRGGQIVTLRLR